MASSFFHPQLAPLDRDRRTFIDAPSILNPGLSSPGTQGFPASNRPFSRVKNDDKFLPSPPPLFSSVNELIFELIIENNETRYGSRGSNVTVGKEVRTYCKNVNMNNEILVGIYLYLYIGSQFSLFWNCLLFQFTLYFFAPSSFVPFQNFN